MVNVDRAQCADVRPCGIEAEPKALPARVGVSAEQWLPELVHRGFQDRLASVATQSSRSPPRLGKGGEDGTRGGSETEAKDLFGADIRSSMLLVSPMRERMLEEEAQHFHPRIRSAWIDIGAGGACLPTSVSGSVDFPVLGDPASATVDMDRAGIGKPPVPARDPPSPSCSSGRWIAGRSTAVLFECTWCHCRPRGQSSGGAGGRPALPRVAALLHGEQRGRKLRGGTAGQSGMYADRCVQISVSRSMMTAAAAPADSPAT